MKNYDVRIYENGSYPLLSLFNCDNLATTVSYPSDNNSISNFTSYDIELKGYNSIIETIYENSDSGNVFNHYRFFWNGEDEFYIIGSDSKCDSSGLFEILEIDRGQLEIWD